MTLRVTFFGNSQSIFSNRHFQALTQTPAKLVGVVDVPSSKRTSTNPARANYPSFVEVALQQGVPVFEPLNPNRPEFVETISDCSPDLFMAVGYMYLLKEPLLSVPRILAANFHASLLPAYRGKHPVFWALRNGERWTGLTVHVMDPNFDTGDILYQVRVRTRKQDSVTSLYDRIMDRSVDLVARLIEDAEQGTLHRTPQPESGAFYYSSVHEENFRLDWSQDAGQLRRWIQTTPGRCFCDIAGQRVFFIDARVVTSRSDAPPGTLIRIGRTGCTVATGKSTLYLRQVKLDQSGELSMPQLCHKLGLEPGDLLQ